MKFTKVETFAGRRKEKNLVAVGDGGQSDAILIWDVVGAVVGGTGTRAGGTAARRVWAGGEEKQRQDTRMPEHVGESVRAPDLPSPGSASWPW